MKLVWKLKNVQLVRLTRKLRKNISIALMISMSKIKLL